MDLFQLLEWKLDEASQGLLADLDEAAKQVNEIRPLDPEVLRRIKEQILGERVFSSNAIEGSTLTLRETFLVLQAGAVLGTRRRREAQEALNLAAAYHQVEDAVADTKACGNRGKFLEIHEVLMRNVNDPIAGCYRNQDAMISGAKYQPPGAEQIADLMDQVFNTIKSELSKNPSDRRHPLVLATWVHWAIARIHPFGDGNGRMSRLWQDLLLLQGRLTAAIIRVEDRTTYYDALTSADEGDCNSLVQLVARRVLDTMQIYLGAQEKDDQLGDWAKGLVGGVSAESAEKRRLEYERWRLKAEQVRDAFERCATLIAKNGSDALEVQVRRYDLIDQAAWQTLRTGGRATKTWFFRVWFRYEDKIIWYIFFFGWHNWLEADEAINLRGPLVSLLVSEQGPGRDRAILLDEIEASPISLRELIIVDKQLIRRNWDSSNSCPTYDVDIEPVVGAKEFIEEVVAKMLVR
jgi:fido (protein-threonine AMPylation protein)